MHDRPRHSAIFPRRAQRARAAAWRSVLPLVILALGGCGVPFDAPAPPEPEAHPLHEVSGNNLSGTDPSGPESTEGGTPFGFTLRPDPGSVIRIRLADGDGPEWLIYRDASTGRVMYRCAAPPPPGNSGCPHPPVALRPPFRLEVTTEASRPVEVVVEQAGKSP